jgi:type IV secretory pathway VirD2 relaxase
MTKPKSAPRGASRRSPKSASDPSQLAYNRHAADDRGRLRVRGRRAEPTLTVRLRAAKPDCFHVKKSSGRGILGGRGRRKLDAKPLRSQRCTTKWSYTTKMDSLRAHGKYIEREGTQKDGSKAVAFGSGVDQYGSMDAALKHWSEHDTATFKAVISPEFGERCDLKKLTESYMQQVEKELHTKLEWCAVTHFNTGHPHVHLIIRAKDDQDKNLRISPDWLKTRARGIAEEEVTKQLGHRTEKDMQIAKERAITADRWTPLDRQILDEAQKNKGFIRAYDPTRKAHDQHVISARLAHLEKLGLARRDGTDYAVSPNLQQALRQVGMLHDRTKMLHAHKAMLTEKHALPEIHAKPEVGTVILGRVVGGGLNEQTDKPYLIIEGHDLRIHMIDQTAALQRMRGAAQLQNGHIVCLEVKQGTKGTYIEAEDFGPYHKNSIPKAALLKAQAVSIERSGQPLAASLPQAVGFAKDFRAAAAQVLALEKDQSPLALRQSADRQTFMLRHSDAKSWEPTAGTREGIVVAATRHTAIVQDVDGSKHAVALAPDADGRAYPPKIGSRVILQGTDVQLTRPSDLTLSNPEFSLKKVERDNPMLKAAYENRLKTWAKAGLYDPPADSPKLSGPESIQRLEAYLESRRKVGLMVVKDKQVVPMNIQDALDRSYGRETMAERLAKERALQKALQKGKGKGKDGGLGV